jgi:hypothetical protein
VAIFSGTQRSNQPLVKYWKHITPVSRISETSRKWTGPQCHLWTSSPAAIHANHSQQQDTEKEKTMSDIYGHLFGMPFARWDHDTQSWRTSEDTSLLDLPMSSLTLPKSGGMQNGQLYQRPPLEPAIAESASSSLLTPTAMDSRWYAEPVKHRPNDISLLPRAIGHLLPTPRAALDHNMNIHPRPSDQPQNLENALALLPTPRAQARDRITLREDYHYNLEEALALLGDNTPKPSSDGNISLSGQHQNLQLWEEQENHY